MEKAVTYIVSVILIAVSSWAWPAHASKTRTVGVVFQPRTEKRPAKRVHLYERMTAVIIGIDNYKDLPASKYLHYAVRDAKGVARVLKERYPFDKVITLYNEEATRDRIMKVLQGDLSRTGPDDAVLIYFAGHGITRSTPQGELGYLVPYDGSLRMDEMYKNISMQQIKADVCPLIPAKHVLIIADACFGGLLLATRSTGVEPSHKLAYLREITREPVRQIITAGDKDQEVLDGGIGGHSVFTGRLISALSSVEDFISARELGLELQKKVYGDAAARGHEQRPLVGEIYGTGDFVFVPDVTKTRAKAEEEVKKVEAELRRLERLKKMAAKREDEARLRELERERLLKEAALKQARLREEALRREEELRKKAEEEARRNLEEQKRREKERLERLAYLKKRAKMLRLEIGSPEKALGLKEAADEVKRINKAIARLEADFEKELQAQLGPVRDYYQPKIREARNIPPRDTMFETEEDYRNRVKKAESEAKRLSAELAKKEEAIRERLMAELMAQKQPLLEQRKKITSQEFPLGASELKMKLVRYNPKDEKYFVTIQPRSKNAGWTAYGADIMVPKKKAKVYWENPDLLIPVVKVKVADGGEIVPKEIAAQGPQGKIYEGTGISLVEPITGMEFVWVPGGCFEMGCGSWTDSCDGDEKPVHRVCVDGFWMGKYEVTQGQWKKVNGNNPSHFKKGDNYPVENVSWKDAQRFIKKLNSMSRGGKFRLPTEAEWEYACRSGGRPEKYCGGDDVDRLAWYDGNSGSHTHPVGTKSPNGLGIYDMSGNVWEWCADWYDKNYYKSSPRRNPHGPKNGSYRVVRGGSWNDYSMNERSASRIWFRPGVQYDILGFRLIGNELLCRFF